MDRRNRSQADGRAQRHQKYRDYSLPRRGPLPVCTNRAWVASVYTLPRDFCAAYSAGRTERSEGRTASGPPLRGVGGCQRSCAHVLTAGHSDSRFAQAPCAAGYTLPRDFCAAYSAGRTERSEGRTASGPPGGGRGGAKGPARTAYRLGTAIKVRAGTLRRRLFPMDRSQSCGSGLPGAAPPSPQPGFRSSGVRLSRAPPLTADR